MREETLDPTLDDIAIMMKLAHGEFDFTSYGIRCRDQGDVIFKCKHNDKVVFIVRRHSKSSLWQMFLEAFILPKKPVTYEVEFLYMGKHMKHIVKHFIEYSSRFFDVYQPAKVFTKNSYYYTTLYIETAREQDLVNLVIHLSDIFYKAMF